jgi:hypothetical protein
MMIQLPIASLIIILITNYLINFVTVFEVFVFYLVESIKKNICGRMFVRDINFQSFVNIVLSSVKKALKFDRPIFSFTDIPTYTTEYIYRTEKKRIVYCLIAKYKLEYTIKYNISLLIP